MKASIQFVTIHDVIAAQARLIDEFGGSPGIRDLGLIESAVAQMQASFSGVELREALPEKIAALGFSLLKNHGFIDGNKRIAFAAMDSMTRINGLVFNTSIDEAERMILDAAASVIDRPAFAAWIAKCIVTKC